MEATRVRKSSRRSLAKEVGSKLSCDEQQQIPPPPPPPPAAAFVGVVHHPSAAPSVWMSPDWSEYPVIENFYGNAPRARLNSFYEVLFSPTNNMRTTTLAQNCASYTTDDFGASNEENEPVQVSKKQSTRNFGSFSYSYASDTSDSTSAPISHERDDEDVSSRQRQMMTPMPISITDEEASIGKKRLDTGEKNKRLYGRRKDEMAMDPSENARETFALGSHSNSTLGRSAWGPRRPHPGMKGEVIPIPTGNRMKDRHHPTAKSNSSSLLYLTNDDAIENPQGGASPMGSSPTSSSSSYSEDPPSPASFSSSSSSSPPPPAAFATLMSGNTTMNPSAASNMLRTKLMESLLQVDQLVQEERKLAIEAIKTAKKKKKNQSKESFNMMWTLLCGANTSEIAQGDGMAFLYEQLAVIAHYRAINQLQRHRRHLNGILQIVTCHNPDLELTEKQLDSFESPQAMLGHDIKYSILQKQVEWFASMAIKRKEAKVNAQAKNGVACFEDMRTKSMIMQKLLEAVSWYRMIQSSTNSRESTPASSSSYTGTCSFGAAGVPAEEEEEEKEHGVTQEEAGASRHSTTEDTGKVQMDAEKSKSLVDPPRKSLQELQVERILSVLDGEDFYSDYNELMCRSDWWEVAQAHFENLIFSKADSRLCQLMHRISKDVVLFSDEELEDVHFEALVNQFGLKETEAKKESSANTTMNKKREAEAAQTRAKEIAAREWIRDPQPDQVLEFLEKLTRRVRKEFEISSDVTKSLSIFMQRTVFPRLGNLCFNQRAVRDCQRKDKLWRKKCAELSHVKMEHLGVATDVAMKIRAKLPSRRLKRQHASQTYSQHHHHHHHRVYLIRAIDAFNDMSSIVPCDLLEELMHGVVVLHHEAALVMGTTQFSVETFFPLLAYVLIHCQLPRIHAQLHLLENYAINDTNVNGEESYYVYCVHAAVEYICNSSNLLMTSPQRPNRTNE